MLILGIETSGKTASCAVYDSEKKSVRGEFTVKTEKMQSQIILPMCEKLLEETELELADIDSFAVSKGPGSYTGIRIGISAVKAITYSLNKKCCGVSELFALAVRTNVENGIVCSIIKARQNLVYCAVYKNLLGKCEEIFSECITESENLDGFLRSLNEDIILTGPDSAEFADKYKNEKYKPADVLCREQNAVSLCRAAEIIGFYDADKLDASYLQLTEAERHLINME
mgnify:FL=1